MSQKYKPAGYKFLDHITELLLPYQPPEHPTTAKPPDVPPWDEYFHAIAQMVALRSKDKGRKVGAVVVSAGGEIVSTGFNWFPRGIREIEARMHDDEKLSWTTHAETNAIFNAARLGTSLKGATIYVTTYPCSGCAQAIVQAGITRVFTYGTYWIKTDPPNHWENAPSILAEAKISVDAPSIRAKDHRFHNDDKMRRPSEPSGPQRPTRRIDAPTTHATAASRVSRKPKKRS